MCEGKWPRARSGEAKSGEARVVKGRVSYGPVVQTRPGGSRVMSTKARWVCTVAIDPLPSAAAIGINGGRSIGGIAASVARPASRAKTCHIGDGPKSVRAGCWWGGS